MDGYMYKSMYYRNKLMDGCMTVGTRMEQEYQLIANSAQAKTTNLFSLCFFMSARILDLGERTDEGESDPPLGEKEGDSFFIEAGEADPDKQSSKRKRTKRNYYLQFQSEELTKGFRGQLMILSTTLGVLDASKHLYYLRQ